MDYTKARSTIKKMASEVRRIEDSYDNSMRGVLLDFLVTEYVSTYKEKLIEMFDYIMKNQKEKRETYGDADTAVTKVKPTGSLDRFDTKKILETDKSVSKILDSLMNRKPEAKPEIKERKIETSYEAMILDDIFCGVSFSLIKIISKKENDPWSSFEFHIRRVKPGTKSVNLGSIRYGDLRDEGYIISIKNDYFGYRDELEIQDERGMLHFYRGFDESYRALREVYGELKRDLEDVDIFSK